MAQIHIATVHKFIDKKIERKLNELHTLGDFVSEYDSIIDIMTKASKHRQEFKDTMISVSMQKKAEMIKLYENKKFMHLSAKEIFNLMQFKNKFRVEKPIVEI